MPNKFPCFVFVALTGFGMARVAFAGDCVAVGGWNFSLSLGAGVRTNPLALGKDIPLLVVPQLSYYGKRFFLDNLDLGVTIVEGGSNTLSLVASPGYDRVFFIRGDLQNLFVSGFGNDAAASPFRTPDTGIELKLRSPQFTFLAGPEWTFMAGPVSGQLDILHGVTGRHHGNELRAAVAIPLLQSRQSVTASVGLTWKSARLVDYYYGVDLIYRPGPALTPFLKLRYTRPLKKKWQLTAFVHYERLGHGIADSPLVDQRDVVTVFAGATYKF
jgi:MipA family protein